MATLVLEKKFLADNGLWNLTLSKFSPTGKLLDSIMVNSGQPWSQLFLKAGQGLPSNYAPIEEGTYDIGPLEWAVDGDFNQSFKPGIGPIWVSIEPSSGNPTRRSAFGFHLDENRGTSPGSAGCVVFKNIADLKKFVAWFDQDPPKKLIVYWKIGNKPDSLENLNNHVFKLFYHDNKLSVVKDKDNKDFAFVKIFVNNGKLGLVLDHTDVEVISATVQINYK